MIVNLPAKLFLNTQIPASLWFIRRGNGLSLPNKNKILFIDARNMGHLINRRTRELSKEDIQTIADTYHNWRNPVGAPLVGAQNYVGAQNDAEIPTGQPLEKGQPQGIAPTEDKYTDIKGFCCAAPIERVKELDYVLTPGRYVGLAEVEDDFDFSERFASLKAEFEGQLKEEAELNQRILENLAKVKLEGGDE